MNYTNTFVGHISLDDTGKAFVKDVRKLLRLSGFRLWIRGGNPDRKQHAKNQWDHAGLRNALPLKYSTYIRLYLRPARLNTLTTNAMSLEMCKGVVKTVEKIYVAHGKNLTATVPAKFQ